MRVPFNKPYYNTEEISNITEAITETGISAGHKYTKMCQEWFVNKTGHQAILTVSCTAALEMAGLLADIKSGDEVIMPSFTFVSTANAFVLRGAKIVYVDIRPDTMNMDEKLVEDAITDKTRAIVPVHYAGVACDMDSIMALAQKHGLLVVEDAAHSVDSFYKGKPLGSIGNIGAFSFHETKNISSGEGGMLVVNDERFIRRAEIIWEKGTNRAEFYRGMVNKYGWCDMGSSFLPSEFNAAYLYAQLEQLDDIQGKRKHIWNMYDEGLRGNIDPQITLPVLPQYATNNAHMYYLLCPSLEYRTKLMGYLKERGVQTTFHYLPLHSSAYYASKHDGRSLPNCDRYADTLVRLPLFYELTDENVDCIVELIKAFKYE